MKTEKDIKIFLEQEKDHANTLLEKAVYSQNENDKDMYMRIYSGVQERILTLEWILKE